MKQKASGIGFDPVTLTFAASDEWWASEIQRNELAVKFRHAPIEHEEKMSMIFDDVSVTNAYARAPPPSSQAGASQIHIDDDGADGSGCELDSTNVTPTKAKGRKKDHVHIHLVLRWCKRLQKIAKDSDERFQFKRICDLFEKREISRNSATSEMKEDPVRDEIKEMKYMVVKDGALPGSEVYFHALQLFT